MREETKFSMEIGVLTAFITITGAIKLLKGAKKIDAV
jgi:hypothetical protein